MRPLSAPCALATTSAPSVENGETSTIVAEMASAATTPAADSVLCSSSGAASGMNAVSSAVEEANAEEFR